MATKVYQKGVNVIIDDGVLPKIIIPTAQTRLGIIVNEIRITDTYTDSFKKSISLADLRDELGNTFATVDLAIDYLTAFVGSFRPGGVIFSNGVNFKFTAQNYTDLVTNVPLANESDLAIVYNSQGVWLINRKLKGTYIYQSGVWVFAAQELQDITQYKIDSIVAGTNISVDNTDPLNPIVSALNTGVTEDEVIRWTLIMNNR